MYSEGQSVRAKVCCVYICLCFGSNQNHVFQVLELDKEKQRFLVTLRCSDLQMSSRSPYSDWSKSLLGEFESYLKERESVLENVSGTMCHCFSDIYDICVSRQTVSLFSWELHGGNSELFFVSYFLSITVVRC